MIIGGPGSGKTWLAALLGTRLGLPVVSIDDFVHDAAGYLRSPALIDADARAAAEATRWIIEGGNSRTYEDRAARAECVIRLVPPRTLRLWRVWRRDGWNRSLLAWTWRYDAVFGARDRTVVEMARHHAMVVEIDSHRALESFLAGNAHPAFPHRP
jgi:adenylate kinase family enzyme